MVVVITKSTDTFASLKKLQRFVCLFSPFPAQAINSCTSSKKTQELSGCFLLKSSTTTQQETWERQSSRILTTWRARTSKQTWTTWQFRRRTRYYPFSCTISSQRSCKAMACRNRETWWTRPIRYTKYSKVTPESNSSGHFHCWCDLYLMTAVKPYLNFHSKARRVARTDTKCLAVQRQFWGEPNFDYAASCSINFVSLLFAIQLVWINNQCFLPGKERLLPLLFPNADCHNAISSVASQHSGLKLSWIHHCCNDWPQIRLRMCTSAFRLCPRP